MLIYSWNEYEIYKNGLKENYLFRGGRTLWWEDEDPTLQPPEVDQSNKDANNDQIDNRHGGTSHPFGSMAGLKAGEPFCLLLPFPDHSSTRHSSQVHKSY